MNKAFIESLLAQRDINDYKWINPKIDIFVEQWVRFRCLFGCDGYGTVATCPPAVPSVAECREMIQDYDFALLIHFPVAFEDKETYSGEIKTIHKNLLKLEKDTFLNGYYKAFLLSPDDCNSCRSCIAGSCREKCVNPKNSRPSCEAMGIDVYKTARSAGYSVNVVKEFGESTDRFSILLIE